MLSSMRALQTHAGSWASPSHVTTIARPSSTLQCRTKALAQRGYARSSSRRRDDDDDDDNEVGWWEKPSANADSNPLDALAPWQTRRLEQAYSVGRRKVQVSALAKELDVDRSLITEWFKRFSKLPDSEQAAILAERRREVEWEENRAKARVAAAAIDGQRGAKGKTEQAEDPQAGFIPFKVRKAQPRDKKIRQDVLRTLEMVYERTPFPSDDVIRSLWDLHKIPKNIAIEWFKAKRKEAQGPAQEQVAAEPSAAAAAADAAAAQQPKSTLTTKQAKRERRASKAASTGDEPAESSSQAQSTEPAAAAATTAASRSAGQATTSQAASASTAAAQQATAKPKKKGRFDDVKIVVSESAVPSTEEKLPAAAPKPSPEETMENLVMSYGELLVKAANKDSMSAAVAPEQPDSWADAWRWHLQRKGASRWKPLNWSSWVEQLSYETGEEVDEELLRLDRS